MKDKPWFAVVYMFAITACLSTVLIGFSRLTRERVSANEQLAFERAVLEAFPEIDIPSTAEVHGLFTARFEKSETAGGAYVYRKDNEIVGYAVPVAGKGFWATIGGVVGVSKDLATITGISFYEQTETPGLGARIVEPEFRGQFEGLTVGPIDRPVGIRPTSVTLSASEVHAITGATQTCVRLEALMNEGLSAWLKAMKAREGEQ
jgi:Na+-transporting NADH:ubiquinone oxidoreductase subunit NqrC